MMIKAILLVVVTHPTDNVLGLGVLVNIVRVDARRAVAEGTTASTRVKLDNAHVAVVGLGWCIQVGVLVALCTTRETVVERPQVMVGRTACWLDASKVCLQQIRPSSHAPQQLLSALFACVSMLGKVGVAVKHSRGDGSQ
jgi:hypothetical protein